MRGNVFVAFVVKIDEQFCLKCLCGIYLFLNIKNINTPKISTKKYKYNDEKLFGWLCVTVLCHIIVTIKLNNTGDLIILSPYS